MARVSFRKYEGLGNDFVVMNAPANFAPEAASRLCDRHFGIGADGVLLIGPGRTRGAAASMTVWNADGSRPEMCGNGIRCVALEVLRQKGEPRDGLVIDTDTGPLACRFVGGLIEVAMGKLVDGGDVELTVGRRTHRFRALSIGNPHAVTFERLDRPDIDELGPRVAAAAEFPNGANVEFAALRADAVDVRVWERGVGWTLACGTGACATLGAACILGHRRFGQWAEVRLPGGGLAIRVEEGSLDTTMRGPARLVFEGEVELP